MAAILNPQYFNIEERLHFLSRLTPLGKKKKNWTQHRASTLKPTFPKWKIKISTDKAQKKTGVTFKQEATRIIFFY